MTHLEYLALERIEKLLGEIPKPLNQLENPVTGSTLKRDKEYFEEARGKAKEAQQWAAAILDGQEKNIIRNSGANPKVLERLVKSNENT